LPNRFLAVFSFFRLNPWKQIPRRFNYQLNQSLICWRIWKQSHLNHCSFCWVFWVFRWCIWILKLNIDYLINFAKSLNLPRSTLIFTIHCAQVYQNEYFNFSLIRDWIINSNLNLFNYRPFFRSKKLIVYKFLYINEIYNIKYKYILFFSFQTQIIVLKY
jgi:hypothetical protein